MTFSEQNGQLETFHPLEAKIGKIEFFRLDSTFHVKENRSKVDQHLNAIVSISEFE